MTAQSKLTAQGQISVPAEVRRKLGLGPGSVLQWEERDGEFLVRRAGRCSSEDIHGALFPDGNRANVAPADIKKGIPAYARARHARR